MSRSRRHRDRWVATATAAAAVAAMVVVAATARPSETADDVLARLALALEAQQRVSWSVEYRYERRTSAGAVAGTVRIWRTPSLRVVADETSLTVTTPRGQVRCQETGSGPRCLADDEGSGAPAAAVVLAVASEGWYRVEDAGRRSVAGEEGTCFTLVHRAGRVVPPLGQRWTGCFALDRIPLATRVARGGGVLDDRVARRVERGVDAGELDDVLARFETTGFGVGGSR